MKRISDRSLTYLLAVANSTALVCIAVLLSHVYSARSQVHEHSGRVVIVPMELEGNAVRKSLDEIRQDIARNVVEASRTNVLNARFTSSQEKVTDYKERLASRKAARQDRKEDG